jgi:YD repeat-containing protein
VTTGTTASYGYDAASELTSATPNGGSTTTQAYNADGQLCWAGAGSASCSSPPTGATLYTSNSVGERTGAVTQSGATTSYGWDQAGNLICETAPNSSGYSCTSPNSSVTSTYAYNGDGLRMSDTPAGGSAQQFTWDTIGSVPALLEDGSKLLHLRFDYRGRAGRADQRLWIDAELRRVRHDWGS